MLIRAESEVAEGNYSSELIFSEFANCSMRSLQLPYLIHYIYWLPELKDQMLAFLYAYDSHAVHRLFV